MAYNYVTVSGTFATLTGTVTFTPPNEVTDVTGTIPVLGPGPAVCTVSGGSFTSPPLLGTDNVGLLPAGWNWLTTVALTGQKAYTYPVLIPAANGTTATLSSLAVSPSGGGSAEGFNNPMTSAGDMITGGAAGAATRVAGNTAAAKNFLTQTGTGSASAAPAWGTIASADMPAGTTSAKGALQLDGTAGNIQAPGITASAGLGTLAAISTHVHPLQDPLALGVAQTLLPIVALAANSVGAGSVAWYQRLMSGGYTISHITVGVQTSSGNICLGAYQTSGSGATAAPGTQYATSGSVACPATGTGTAVALGGSCTPNLTDWMAIAADNNTATFYVGSGNANAISAASTYEQTSTFPLPGSASSLIATSARIFALRGS